MRVIGSRGPNDQSNTVGTKFADHIPQFRCFAIHHRTVRKDKASDRTPPFSYTIHATTFAVATAAAAHPYGKIVCECVCVRVFPFVNLSSRVNHRHINMSIVWTSVQPLRYYVYAVFYRNFTRQELVILFLRIQFVTGLIFWCFGKTAIVSFSPVITTIYFSITFVENPIYRALYDILLVVLILHGLLTSAIKMIEWCPLENSTSRASD